MTRCALALDHEALIVPRKDHIGETFLVRPVIAPWDFFGTYFPSVFRLGITNQPRDSELKRETGGVY